ncbi:glycosyltransferase [Salegentibacter sp. 24]|uniref:glycosyltransferase n=1 Tax=Salegentibacter sp. 24 TaxID=2183986 RepID=UPI0014151608|nr:glycosyltransferase [Salegentibacter sp. 24]
MKILHLIHKPQNRGAETFACQLASHQKRLKHDIKIVTVYNGKSKLPWIGPIGNLNGQEDQFFDWKAWKRLAKEIKDFQPDIVQANSGDTLKYSVISKRIFGWKTPIIFRNASEVGQYLNQYFQKKFNTFLYRNIAAVASVSEKSRKDLIEHFPFLKLKTKVIPIGLEGELNIKPVEFSDEADYNIVHVGGFTFEKNHEGLLRIFKKVVEKESRTQLHLIGDGPLRIETEGLVREFGIEEYVTFYGFVNNPLDYIKASQLLILPSNIEGLPGVLLEAMYCKTPVVAYDVGGINEIINIETGTLVEKGNEKEFTNAILDNLKKINSSQIEKAYEMVTEKFINSKLAVEFLVFYKRVIGK